MMIILCAVELLGMEGYHTSIH